MSSKIKITKIEEPKEPGSKQDKLKKLTPFIVISVFIIPLLLAWILFENTDKWNPATRSFGTLINPPVQLIDLKFKTENNLRLELDTFKGHWVLMFITGISCGEPCINNLYTINQVRLAMGKKSAKISNLFVTLPDEKQNPIFTMLKSQYPTILYVTVTPEQLKAFSAQLPPTLRPLNEGRLYIIDPRGFAMMSYPEDANPNVVLKDIKKIVQG